MCRRGHPDRYRSLVTGRCKVCHLEASDRWRGWAPKRQRYRLNLELFRRLTPHGSRLRIVELCGVSQDCMRRMYRSKDVLNAAFRERLAKALGVAHDELWITVSSKDPAAQSFGTAQLYQ